MKKIYFIILITLSFALFSGCGKTEKTVLQPPVVQTPETISQSPSSEGQSTSTEPSQEESSSPSQTQEVKLYLNGNRLPLSSVPFIDGDVVMVPVADICKAFSRDISISYEGSVMTLVDSEKSNTIVLTDGESKAMVNGSPVYMQASVKVMQEGVFFVELSSFSTLFGADNKYQADISAIYITESGLC